MLSLFIALLAVALYAKTVNYDFAYDDVLRIEFNPLVNAPVSQGLNLKNILTSPAPPGNLYRPVSTFTLRANYYFSGFNPASYHLVNIILYALCVFLISQLLFLLIEDQLAAGFSALLFTVHPICTEVVANIVGRQELLAALFGIGALRFLMFSKRISQEKIKFVTALFLFVLAVHSKESAYTLALLLPVCLYFYRKSQGTKVLDRSFWIILLGLITTTAACLTLRYYILGDSLLIKSDSSTEFFENPMFHLGFLDRIIPGLYVLGKYAQLILLPLRQSANYDFLPELFFKEVYSISGLFNILIVALLLLLTYRMRRKSWAVFGLWFFITFASTLNILTPIGTLMGERLAFLPSIGLVAFFISFLFWILKKHSALYKILPIAFLCIALIFALRTSQRMEVWKNHATIFKASVIDAPNSPKAALNLAVHYLVRENDLEAAKFELKKAVNLAPNYLRAMDLLVRIAEMQKDDSTKRYWLNKIEEVKALDRKI
ncbi:MAG: hypothetical protein R3A13_04325 [Bdellovibrionota bacterium]